MNHIILMIATIGLICLAALVLLELGDNAWFSARYPALSARLGGAARSKTIWLNAIGAALIDQLPVALPDIMLQFPALQPIMPENVYQTLMAGMIIINIMLRFVTTKPLEAK